MYWHNPAFGIADNADIKIPWKVQHFRRDKASAAGIDCYRIRLLALAMIADHDLLGLCPTRVKGKPAPYVLTASCGEEAVRVCSRNLVFADRKR